jgi:hypothetical protein
VSLEKAPAKRERRELRRQCPLLYVPFISVANGQRDVPLPLYHYFISMYGGKVFAMGNKSEDLPAFRFRFLSGIF